jgi:hypothetical protein
MLEKQKFIFETDFQAVFCDFLFKKPFLPAP